MSTGGSNKLKIVGYKDIEFKNKIGEYTALVNPETYSLSHNVNVNDRSAQGSYVPTISFNKGDSQTLSFKLLFDGTGVLKKGDSLIPQGVAIVGASAPNVVDDINLFKKLVYVYDNATHQPPFVQILWGVLSFNGRLTRLNFNYKLYKPDGTPLRAEADCSFIGAIDEKKLAAIQDKQSPDLTHIRVARSGDTLPLMCYREYGDSRYYYQVARFNKLTNIKQLAPGMKILFPPLITN